MGRTRLAIGLFLAATVLVIGAAVAWEARYTISHTYAYLRDPPKSPAERGNGGPARALLLYDPGAIDRDRAGNVYIVDRGRGPTQGSIIWKIDTNGIARAVAGTGRRGNAATGIPALRSDLGMAVGLSVDPLGQILFVDNVNHVLLRVASDGTITRIAGTGAPGYSGDGGPANEAALNAPYDVHRDSQGNIYIADTSNHRIRKVSPHGIITTVAGIGEPGYAGDDGPAIEAKLNKPYNILIDGKDRLLIDDSNNHVIRRVDDNGVITTIVGSGRKGYAGDGGPALEARLDTPQALFLAAKPLLYVGDEHNHVVRVLGPDGTLSHLIGTGEPGFAADGTPARVAPLNDPEGILVREDGSIIILDGDNGRVIEIDTEGRARNFAGRGIRSGG